MVLRHDGQCGAGRAACERRVARDAQHLGIVGGGIHEAQIEISRQRRRQHEEDGVGRADLRREQRREAQAADPRRHVVHQERGQRQIAVRQAGMRGAAPPSRESPAPAHKSAAPAHSVRPRCAPRGRRARRRPSAGSRRHDERRGQHRKVHPPRRPVLPRVPELGLSALRSAGQTSRRPRRAPSAAPPRSRPSSRSSGRR